MSTPAARVVRTVCSPNCSGTCGVNAHVRDGRILKIEPADFPDPRYRRICLKGMAMAMQRVTHPDRLRHPLRRVGARGEGRFERISWDEAFDHLAAELTRIAARHGQRANAWTTMTGNYGVRAVMAPNRIANCLEGTWFTYVGLMGDLGCAMGFLPTLGVFATGHEWEDLVGARLIVIFARNVADTAHSEMHFLFDALEAGARLVVVDPRYSRTATKADQWVSPRPGTDAALILGMLNVILDAGLHDADYLLHHTNAPFLVREDTGALLRMRDLTPVGDARFVVCDSTGGETCPVDEAGAPRLSADITVQIADGRRVRCRSAFAIMREAWAAYTPQRAAGICEVPAAVIRDLAREYATTQPAAIWLGQGAQRYRHGHLAFRAATTLAAVCGNIGRRHAGVSWSDGAMLRVFFNVPGDWLEPGGRRAHTLPGTRMLETIARGEPYTVKSLWLAGYGFGTQSPNFDRFVREALPKLELFAVTEQVMTPAAQYADIVLPCVSYYEDDLDVVPSAENLYVQLRRRAIAPIGESKNDWDIFAGVCERVGRGEDWRQSAEESCRQILEQSGDPAVRALDWDSLARDGVARLDLPRPHVPFADQRFPTESGRVELYTERLREFGQAVLVHAEPLESNRAARACEFPLTLMTSHPMHTVHSQHTNLAWIRELLPGPRLEMHPRDAGERGIRDGDPVSVWNDRGRVEVRVTLTEAVRPGMLNLPQGWWPRDFAHGHYNDLSHLTPNPVQDAILETNFPVWDVLVQVARAGAPAGGRHGIGTEPAIRHGRQT
ncbi:MAG: molybdopterin-dependent oxidoreductase [Gammaproteobacteria bacterium]|nr:molybdopterin-dependent oxidoreductase [Gammaproteobacteria bacterium]